MQVDKSKCVGCGACMGMCPVMAIQKAADGKAEIDTSKCVQCHTCASVCPMSAIMI